MAYWNVTFNPQINMDELINLIIQINAQKLALSNIPLPPSIRKSFDVVNVTKQIKASTRIEGSQLSNEEVEEAMQKSQSDSSEEREVIAAFNLHKYIVETAKNDENIIIDENLIKTFHEIITKDIDDSDYMPGQYRTEDLRVGKNHKPTAFEDVPAKMNKFIEFINSKDVLSLGPLIRAIIAHFYLVSIHPFKNGNGRTSRALEAYLLYCGGYNQLGFYSLSNYYYKHYQQYFEELDSARFKYSGNLMHFVIFALNGFLEEVNQISSEAYCFVKKRMFKDYLEEMHLDKDSKISRRGYLIAIYLLENDVSITKKKISNGGDPLFDSLLDRVSTKTIYRDIKCLVENKLLKWEGDTLTVNIDIMDKFK